MTLLLVHDSNLPLEERHCTTWAGALEVYNETALAFPDTPDGELARAMEVWRQASPEQQAAMERELGIAPLRPGEKTQFPLKGIIPIHMYMLLDHFYPNFLKDEEFLDELFTTVGKQWANPRWHPKPPNMRQVRGPSTYAKSVLKMLADGSLVPLLKTLRYGDGPVGNKYKPELAAQPDDPHAIIVAGR